MLNCIVLGDSLAVGVGLARPDCETAAISGVSSDRYVQMFPGTQQAHTAIISLGVNDGDANSTIGNLTLLRGRISADTVYWLLAGGNERARDAVREVAQRFGDRLIDAAPLAGPDHIHPDSAGYAQLAAETRGSDAPPPPRASAPWALPGIKVWNGPDNLNGTPIHQQSP